MTFTERSRGANVVFETDDKARKRQESEDTENTSEFKKAYEVYTRTPNL